MIPYIVALFSKIGENTASSSIVVAASRSIAAVVKLLQIAVLFVVKLLQVAVLYLSLLFLLQVSSLL